MRPIKFMGKPVDSGDWVYGYYYKIKEMCFITSYDKTLVAFIWHEVIPESAGQFTGEVDKHKKELYSGHIVRPYINNNRLEPLVIKYLGHGFSMAGIDDKDSMDCVWYFDFEIIGTTTDDGELLK